MANVGMITANLVANTTRFTRPMVHAQGELQNFNKRAEAVTKRLENVTRAGRAAGLALGALTGAIGLAARQAARYGDEIDKMSIRTGIGREELQELQHVANLSGVSFDSLTRATTRLGQQMVDNEGKTNATSQTISRLGLELRNAQGEVRDMGDLFDDAIDALSRMDNEVERNTAAIRLFGRQGQELIPILAAGQGEVDRMRREARDLGLVMGDTAIRDLAQFNDEMGTVQRRVSAAGRDLLMEFLPAIRVVLDWIGKGVTWFQNLDAEQRQNIVRWVALAGGVLGLVAALGLFAKAATVAISWLKILGIVKAVLLGPWVLGIGLLTAAVLLLWQAWDKNWLGIRDVVERFANTVQRALSDLHDFIMQTRFGQEISNLIKDIRDVWDREDITLAAKIVEIAGLILGPVMDKIRGLIADIQEIWDREDLTLLQKIVQIAGLILGPIISQIRELIADIQGVWAREDLTLKEKLVEVARLFLDVVDWQFLLAGAAIALLIGKVLFGLLPAIPIAAITLAFGILKALTIAGLTALKAVGAFLLAKVWTITLAGISFVWGKILAITIAGVTALKAVLAFLAAKAWVLSLKGITFAFAKIAALTIGGAKVLAAVTSFIVGSITAPGVAIALGALALLGGAFFFLNPAEERAEIFQRIKDIIADESLSIVVKIGQVTMEFLRGAVAGARKAVTDFVDWVSKPVDPTVEVPISPFFPGLGTMQMPGVTRRSFQAGGLLPGMGGPDSIPAMLAPGEAIIPGSIWRKGIAAVAEWFKAMGAPGFQAGGIVGGNTGGGNGGLLGQLFPDLSAAIAEQGGIIDTAANFVADIPQMIVSGMSTMMNMLIDIIGQLAETALGEQEAARITDSLRKGQAEMERFLGALGFATDAAEDVQGALEDIPEEVQATLGMFERLRNVITEAVDSARFFATATVQSVRDWRRQVSATIQEVGLGRVLANLLENAILTGIEGVKSAGEWLGGQLVQTGLTLQQFGQNMAAALGPMGLVNALLSELAEPLSILAEPIMLVAGALAEALLPVIKALFPVIRFFAQIMLSVAGIVGRVWNALLDLISAIPFVNLRKYKMDLDALSSASQELASLTWEEAEARRNNTDALEESTRAMVNVPSIFRIALRRAQVGATTAINNGQGMAMQQFPIQAMATGGIVRRPTLAMIGERGPEAVTPLDDMPTGEPIQITINLNGPVFGMNDLQRVIETAISRAARSAGLAEHGLVVKFT